MRCGVSVRAGLKEAIDALWSRTRVKRRKAFLGGRAGTQRRCPVPVDAEGVVATRSRRNLSVSPQEICWVPRFGRPENERTKADGPAEVGGPRSTGRRGNARRAHPLERGRAREGGPGRRTALQLCLPIATAENPRGATRRRTRDRLGAVRAGVPKAIVNAENATSATMEQASTSLPPSCHNWRYGDDFEVANRPAAGLITRCPEEPYTNSVRTVLWEPGRVTVPATRLRR